MAGRLSIAFLEGQSRYLCRASPVRLLTGQGAYGGTPLQRARSSALLERKEIAPRLKARERYEQKLQMS